MYIRNYTILPKTFIYSHLVFILRGVRAESRWVGVDVIHSNNYSNTNTTDNIACVDTLVGVCDAGKYYVVNNALDMTVAT